MAWNSYGLDQAAQQLVLAAKKRDRDSLNQAHKMRMSVAYGLERFWGEALRLEEKEPAKAQYWRDTWTALVAIMVQAGVTIPNDAIPAISDRRNQTQVTRQAEAVEAMAQKLWQLELDDQRVTLAVLTQLCDCLVWWTQRHK